MYTIRKKTSVIVLTGTLLIISIFLFSCKNKRSESTSVEKEITKMENKEFNIDNARKEIDVANREFMNLFNKSDSIGLANMFTYDGKSMEPNEPAFIGRANIQTHYSLVMNAGANKLGLTTIGLWGDEKMLVEEGEYTFIDENDKLLDKGKYIVLWRIENGKWKLHLDCYNSDLPMHH
jgi:ketosteroid isomerase-like protein